MHNVARILWITLSLGVGGAIGACTMSTDATATQCRSQEDCLARGPDFADTTCSEQRVCVKLQVGTRSCNTNRECIERNGGGPFTCRKDGKCVPLTSPECPRVLAEKEDLLDDNTIFIGQITPANVDGATADLSVDLARTEIKRALGGGFPPASAGGPKRPLAIITCSPEPVASSGVGSAAETNRALTHLQDVVRVQAQLGPYTSSQSVPGALAAIAHNTLMLTQNQVGQLTFLDDHDLVFRLGFSNVQTVSLLPKFLNEYVVPRLFTDGILATADEEVRIALVLDFDSVDMSEVISKVIGRPFKVFDIGNVVDRIGNPNPTPAITKSRLEVYAYKPHIILFATSPSGVNSVMVPMDRTWPTDVPRPIQISMLPSWANFIVGGLNAINVDQVRQRYYGMQTVSLGFKQESMDLLTAALRLKFPELANQQTSQGTALMYDSVYLLLYSTVAIGDQPITGPNLARGMRRVADGSGGTDVNWGVQEIPKALAALAKGENISFTGVQGTYLYDKNGDRPGNPEVFCVASAAGKATLVKSSGYGLDVSSGRTTGAVNCPP